MNKLPFVFSLLALLGGGCVAYKHPVPQEAKEAIRDADKQATAALKVPDAVQADLLPPNPMAQQTSSYVRERRFRVAAKDVDAPEFFASLMKDGRYSVAVHPGVTGKITLDLRDVTLSEVLETAASMYGFDVQRTGNVYHIYPAGLRTESFPVNYLMLTRHGQSRSSITSGGVTDQSNNNVSTTLNSGTSTSGSSNDSNSSNSNNVNNGTVIETGSQSDFWKDLETALTHLVGTGEGRAVILNPQAGMVTVKGMPEDLKAVRDFLAQSERQLKRQVILETKIMEVRLNEGYQQGIQWSDLSAQWNTGKGFTGNSLVNLPDVTNSIATQLGGGAALKFTDGSFEAVVNLLKTQGDVNTLSSPRVTATNNQKAVIKVGSDEYFVTGISSSTVVTSGSPVVMPNIELTPFFSGVALDVMPQIDDQGNVLMHIHPSVIDVTEQQKIIDLGNNTAPYSLPMAYSKIRESDTVVQARSGDVIVIGGLMRINKEQQVSKVPWIGDIPWVGEAFTNRQDSTYKTELVIMMKPQVVEGETWQQELQRSGELLEKWYPEAR